MATQVFGAEVTQALRDMQQAARQGRTTTIVVDGTSRTIPFPFPSPPDWRDCWIYFALIDRFNNPSAPPVGPWDQKVDFRQGGTFAGVQRQLAYLQDLGVRALWLSPVLKNSKPPGFAYTYPGYNTQDFLNVDARFASDGSQPTAERELKALVNEAHARGMYVILDIVLNHAARVFDYLHQGTVTDQFSDPAIMAAPLGQEPPIQWLNGLGFPRPDWQDALPPPAALSPDDAVWPIDLQRREFFRRRGSTLTDKPGAQGFVPGDFGVLRQLVAEYDALAPGQEALRTQYGRTPVLAILIRAYQYLIAKYDIDGFRIDTVKYVAPAAVETFGNAIREFALSVGKANFFTFGEIYDDEATINHFVGRNSGDVDGFGIDAALDFPLFYVLPRVAKPLSSSGPGVEAVRTVFQDRKIVEEGLISSHGDAGRYFVSFLDNHDQHRRFNDPGTPREQVTLGLALLMSLQGIPCIYYGTEQGLQGTNDGHGHPTLDSNESVREALWGRGPTAFDRTHFLFQQIKALAHLRGDEPALRYGRLYFREVSGNGQDFGHSRGPGGIVAFSRILNESEVIVLANTNFAQPFTGFVLRDSDIARQQQSMTIGYSNRGSTGSLRVQMLQGRVVQADGTMTPASIAALPIRLQPMEAQIIVPA
jgi:glycosidase